MLNLHLNKAFNPNNEIGTFVENISFRIYIEMGSERNNWKQNGQWKDNGNFPHPFTMMMLLRMGLTGPESRQERSDKRSKI